MKKKILFIYTNYSSFVKTDFEILASENEVTQYQYKPVKGMSGNVIQILKQLFFLVFNIWKFDAIFIWFADYHSFLPVLFAKILGKKSFVVIGGYDVARIPSLNYGGLLSKPRGFCTVHSMKYCTMNLTVSKYVDRKVKWIAKNATTKMIYNCVNIKSTVHTETEREDLVITVGLINSERAFYLKGIDTFFEVAKLLPEYRFLVIGVDKAEIHTPLLNTSLNLEFVGPVKHEELERYYRRAKVYCQFSRSESFGVSIVEAMFFGCTPIVTKEGGMPEVVGEKGVKREPKAIANLIHRKIISFPENEMKSMAKTGFGLKQRQKLLLKILDG